MATPEPQPRGEGVSLSGAMPEQTVAYIMGNPRRISSRHEERVVAAYLFKQWGELIPFNLSCFTIVSHDMETETADSPTNGRTSPDWWPLAQKTPPDSSPDCAPTRSKSCRCQSVGQTPPFRWYASFTRSQVYRPSFQAYTTATTYVVAQVETWCASRGLSHRTLDLVAHRAVDRTRVWRGVPSELPQPPVGQTGLELPSPASVCHRAR
jgi:hypothetical protein